MGYELHITRAEHPLDAASHPIGRDEWNEFAYSDRCRIAAARDTPGLLAIAESFAANLVGDDGERYTSYGIEI